MTIDDEPFDPRDEEPDLNQLIDGWLNEARPERYEYRDRDLWMDEVYDKAATALQESPPEHVARDRARQMVRRREGDAGGRAFRFLKRLVIDGQPPLGWDGVGDEWQALCGSDFRLPLRINDDARVRVGAASAKDLEEWITAELDRQTAKWAESEMAREGAAWLIERMREQGVQRVEDLRFGATDDKAA